MYMDRKSSTNNELDLSCDVPSLMAVEWPTVAVASPRRAESCAIPEIKLRRAKGLPVVREDIFKSSNVGFSVMDNFQITI